MYLRNDVIRLLSIEQSISSHLQCIGLYNF